MMTEEQRAGLRDALASVRARRATLAYSIRSVTDQIAGCDELMEMIAQASVGISVEQIGECEGCNAVLLPGDLISTTSEDCELCESCAPTWADLIQQVNQLTDDEIEQHHGSEATRAGILASLRDHGDLAAKAVHRKG